MGFNSAFKGLRKTAFETHRRRCEDNIEMDLTELGWRKWTGLIWLRSGTEGGRFRMWSWTFLFHKMRGISRLAEYLLCSEEDLLAPCSKLVKKDWV